MIVVDASALVALGDDEPEAESVSQAIAAADRAVVSPINAVEAALVLIGRGRFDASEKFQNWLAEASVEVWVGPVDFAEALSAYLTFGKGFHRARLNLGDIFAYALAKQLDTPLLYKGDDFALTDIRSAL